MDEIYEHRAGHTPVFDRTVVSTVDGSDRDIACPDTACPTWGGDLTERFRELFVHTDPDLRIWLERSLWLSRWV